MTIPTDENRDLLTVVASMRAKPGKEQELRAALESLVHTTRAEDGCVVYTLHQGSEDPAVFYFYENWESAEKLDAHLAAPHLAEVMAGADDLLEGGVGGLLVQRLNRIA